MTTKITEQNISNIANLGVQWQSKVTSDGSTVTTMAAGKGYFVDNTSAAGLVKLPLNASAGDTIIIKDYAGNFATNNTTIQRNGHKMDGLASDSVLSNNNEVQKLVYVDTTRGWVGLQSGTETGLSPDYVAATGGTVTTSGDFKVHTFTGDGNFVVSNDGNPAGSTAVDYLVVAGGGGGGRDNFPQNRTGGGGGAGGFRVSNSYSIPAPTTSPLASPTGITVSVQTYPITVGGGGVGGNNSTGQTVCGGVGSNSVFSTITSAGGGGGIGHNQSYGVCTPNPHSNTNKGGSGGGVGEAVPNPSGRGVGNTPPVSPPQGNPAGATGGGQAPNYYASGGGGAGAAGGVASTPKGGDGGIGSFISTCFAVGCAGTPGPVGSTRYFAGGGASHSCSTGGAGGGGPSPAPNVGQAGTANTGGGGGGSRANDGGAGGKGIVIIRYKFQN